MPVVDHEFTTLAAGRMAGHEGYDDVIKRAERLFNRLRYSVAQQSAPTTLKAAYLDPIKTRLGLEVSLDLFAKSDEQFMSMFTGACVLVDTGRRD